MLIFLLMHLLQPKCATQQVLQHVTKAGNKKCFFFFLKSFG